MKSCVVFNCNSNYRIKRKFLSFHKFPKSPNLLKQWIKFCGRKDIFNTNYARICSRHFSEDDFNNNLKFKMGFCEYRTIKPNAVPSLRSGNNSDVLNDSKRSKRIETRTRKKIVEALLNESNEKKDISAVGKEDQATSAILEDINTEIDHLQNNLLHFEDVNITPQESSYFADENRDNIYPKRYLTQNSNKRKESDLVTEIKCKIIERIKGSESYIEQTPKPTDNSSTILEKTDILLCGLDPMNRKEAEIKIMEYLWKCTIAQSKSQRIENLEI